MQRTLSAFWSLKRTYVLSLRNHMNQSYSLFYEKQHFCSLYPRITFKFISWPSELLWSILAQLAVLTYLYWHITHLRACLLVFLAKQIQPYLVVFLKELFLFSWYLLASWYLLGGRLHRQHKGHLYGMGENWERSIAQGHREP